MTWQHIYLIANFFAAAISLGISVYSWRHRARTGALAFAGLMLAVAFWLLTSILVSMSQDPAQARQWVNPRYLGLTVLLAFFITFTLQYTGREKWLSKKRLTIIFAIPLITQIVIETNSLHRWFLVEVDFSLDGILMGLDPIRYGSVFWLHTIYSYLLVLIGIGLIIQKSIYTFILYRGQAMFMVLGILPPLFTSVIDAFLLIPGLKHPLAPLGFALMGIAFFWALFQYRMLDIVPVAREIVIDSMSDGMIVLDRWKNVVDVNPSVQQFVGLELDEMIGKPSAQVFHPWSEIIEKFLADTSVETEIALNISGQERWFELRVFPLKDRQNHLQGSIFILRDITLRKQSEHQLQQTLTEVKTLQSKLYDQASMIR